MARRYFWCLCRRWGSALFYGTLMAVVLVYLVRYFKSGDVPEGALLEQEYNVFLFVLFSLGGLLYMIARYKFKNPNRD